MSVANNFGVLLKEFRTKVNIKDQAQKAQNKQTFVVCSLNALHIAVALLCIKQIGTLVAQQRNSSAQLGGI